MSGREQYTSIAWACRSLRDNDPRLLPELARSLRAKLNPLSEFNPDTLFVTHPRPDEQGFYATYEDLAAYVEKATGRYIPALFETTGLAVDAERVLISSDFVRRIVGDIRERLGLTYAVERSEANAAVSIANVANSSPRTIPDQPPPMSEDGLRALAQQLAHANDQRKAQEAAGREAIARQAAEAKVLELQALLDSRDAENRVIRQQLNEANDANNDLRRELAEARQDREYLNGQIDNVAGLVAFMDPTNPLSPPIGRESVIFWCEATSNGQIDPTKATGRGIGPQSVTWWEKRHGSQPSLNVKQALKTVCTPACRKKGGLVSKS